MPVRAHDNHVDLVFGNVALDLAGDITDLGSRFELDFMLAQHFFRRRQRFRGFFPVIVVDRSVAEDRTGTGYRQPCRYRGFDVQQMQLRGVLEPLNMGHQILHCFGCKG